MQQHLLDWNKPALASLISLLAKQHIKDNLFDLSNITIVLPSARIGRRLQVLLVEFAAKQQIGILAPEIITIGALINKLLDLKQPLGYETQRVITWLAVVNNNRELLEPLFATANRNITYENLLTIIANIEQVYSDLSAGLLTAKTVSELLFKQGMDYEAARWVALDQLINLFRADFERYFPDHLGQRVDRSTNKINYSNKVVLAGCIDLSKLAVHILDQLESVTVVTFADTECKDSFDQYGCLISQNWRRPKYNPDLGRVHLVKSAQDQAHLVGQLLYDNSDWLTLSQISIASTKDNDWKVLSNELERLQLKYHRAQGVSYLSTKSGLLLSTLATYFSKQDFANFAALCRHPALYDFLLYQFSQSEHKLPATDLLNILNDYQRSRLPLEIDVTFSSNKVLSQVLKILTGLIAPIYTAKNISEFSLAVANLLDQLFVEQYALTNAEAELISQTLSSLAVLPEAALSSLPSIQLYWQLLLNAVTNINLPDLPADQAIDLLGWLELQLDDANFVIVTDFNEGYVPQSIKPNWLLPDRIRQQLGLANSQTRLARDSYILSALVKQTKQLHFIVPQQSLAGDSLLPCNLLFDLKQQQTTSQLERLFCKQGLKFAEQHNKPNTNFTLPPLPTVIEPLKSISITALSAYLRCPYEFYLKYVLKLTESHDRSLELDALEFGNLVHNILSDFAKSGPVKSSSAKDLTNYFNDLVSERINKYFGRKCEPAVLVQLEQVRARLNVFANLQAKQVQAGWQIVASEYSWPKDQVNLETYKGNIYLTGRIDRIDQYRDQNVFAVYDYKTGDRAITIDKLHRKIDRKSGQVTWLNYQLPAYFYALQKLNYFGNDYEQINVGLINLAASLDEINFSMADWSNADFESAWQQMQQTAANILENKFWPPQLLPQPSSPFYRLYGSSMVIASENVAIREAEEGQ